MVSYPQFQDLEVADVTYVQAARDIANLKDQPTDLRLKLGTEAIQWIKTLMGKMLKDSRYDNIWADIKPIYILSNNLLVVETD